MSIKEKRNQRGWTQSQLAEYSGLSQRTIQRIEKGNPATTETLKCLAAVFETDVAALGVVEILDESRLSDEE
ncbi:MAG: XRE family transcriptional regulator, partial [Moraxellaceae bacterium]